MHNTDYLEIFSFSFAAKVFYLKRPTPIFLYYGNLCATPFSIRTNASAPAMRVKIAERSSLSGVQLSPSAPSRSKPSE